MSQSMQRLALMILGPMVLAVAVLGYYLTHLGVASTDNAYVQQDKVSVSAEVGGPIVEVAVRENQRVAAGDLLFRIDAEPFQLAVAEARAALAAARAHLEELEIEYATADVDIDRALEEIVY